MIRTFLLFDIDCLAHQYQLMVLGSLTEGDALFKTVFDTKFGYFGSLSKLLLVWHEHARDVYDEWVKQYGPVEAITFARQIPPKCIRGRWGAVSYCEEFALAPPTDHLVSVLLAVAERGSVKAKPAGQGAQRARRGTGTVKNATEPVGSEAAQQLDEAYTEDIASYREKMACWRADVINRIAGPRLWAMMRVSNKLRQPLDHFARYVLQKRASTDIKTLASLVWYKAKALSEEMAEAMSTTHHDELWNVLPPSLVQQCMFIAHKLAARVLADFEARILGRFRSDAIQLLWVGCKDPDTQCVERSRVFQHLLRSKDAALHQTAWKFKRPGRPYLRKRSC